MIAIILLTYQRTEYALRTIQAIQNNLGGEYGWVVADDGSNRMHTDAIKHALNSDILDFRSQRAGYGHNANWAWRRSMDYSDVTLWLEDDWTLLSPFDYGHYAKRLRTDPSIGMIRLSRVPIGLNGDVVGDGREVYLRLHKNTQYVFSGNPSLRHYRFFEAYGEYPTGHKPGDTEVHYDSQVLARNGPDILIPWNIGTWGLFGHIGEVKSY